MAGDGSSAGVPDPDMTAIAAVIAGETARFGEIYRRHYSRVHSYARGVLRDATEAEDVAQETFLLALRALPRFEDRGVPFRAWLLRIAHNVALKRIGARRDQPVDGQVLARVLDDRRVHDVDVLADGELVALTAELPLAYRQVLVLRLMLGFSAVEAGTILGRSPDGVRQIQRRALESLRKRIMSVDAPTPTRLSRQLALVD